MKRTPLKLTGLKSWYKGRQQKKKEKAEEERNAVPSALRWLTFLFTLIAMALGMSFLPLFPQPLPILIAVLVAFVTFRKPNIGTAIGGAVIGFGLISHLAELVFISFLGDTRARIVFIAVWMSLFVAVPLVFKKYQAALAVDFGILSVVTLFFAPIYFLAIPLIFASAVFFKKYVSLTVIYYVLLTVPLQIMQYYKYVVLPITRVDWWMEPGAAPPLLVPLTSIGRDLTAAMSQFRLYDSSKVIYDIAGQLTWVPDWTGRTIGDAVQQYVNSVPGLLLFVVIVVGLGVTLMWFSKTLVKTGLIGVGDKFFQIFTVTIASALFFVMLSSLQLPLAFTADVSPLTMLLAIFATLLLTLPIMFIDTAPKQTTTLADLKAKAEALQEKLGIFMGQIANIKANIPVVVSGPEGRIVVIKDSVDDTIRRINLQQFDQYDMDKKFSELQAFTKEKEACEEELNTILAEYQIFTNCEFSKWMGKLKVTGLDIKTPLNAGFEKEMPLEQRIEAIKQTVEGGKTLTREVIAVVDPIYGIIRPLYDPILPEKCRSVEFANEKLAGKEAPWIAIEALYSSLQNWRRQYGSDIFTSLKFLKTSLSPIASLSRDAEVLPFVFGDNTPKVLDYAKQAEGMRFNADKRLEREEISMTDIVALQNDVSTFLAMANDVLKMLYEGLISEEDAIEHLLPTQEYVWEKNSSLRERLKKATETLSNPSKYRINQIMENLPTYLSYVGEAVQTIAIYNERKEFLLNYPLAEAVITQQLKAKERLTPKDLPFQPRFAAEYLKLYYMQRFADFAFDKDEQVLTRRETSI